MTLGPTLKMGGVIGVIAIVCGFWLWFFLTCCILIAMEGCSAMVSLFWIPPARHGPCDGTNAHHSCTRFVCSGSRRSPSTPSSRATCSRRFLSLRCWRRTRGWLSSGVNWVVGGGYGIPWQNRVRLVRSCRQSNRIAFSLVPTWEEPAWRPWVTPAHCVSVDALRREGQGGATTCYT